MAAGSAGSRTYGVTGVSNGSAYFPRNWKEEMGKRKRGAVMGGYSAEEGRLARDGVQ